MGTYNIARDFAQYLEDNGFGTFGIDLYVGAVPKETEHPDDVMWVIAGGGNPIIKNTTGEMMKEYLVSVYYRNTSSETVHNTMQELEELINADGCTQLTNFDTVDLDATLFPADQDLDAEDRDVQLLEVTVTTYKGS